MNGYSRNLITARKRLLSRKYLLWVTVGICVALSFLVITTYRFLAISRPEGKGILVVEAWIPASALAASVNVFKSGNYESLVVVGGPIQSAGGVPGHPATYPDLAATRLEQYQFDSTKLIKINVPPASSNRTLAEAESVRHWFENSAQKACCVDVFTIGVHARKSWILSRYELGDICRVGVISGPQASYDPKYWFASRAGIRLVLRNLVGYAYYKIWIINHRFLRATPHLRAS